MQSAGYNEALSCAVHGLVDGFTTPTSSEHQVNPVPTRQLLHRDSQENCSGRHSLSWVRKHDLIFMLSKCNTACSLPSRSLGTLNQSFHGEGSGASGSGSLPGRRQRKCFVHHHNLAHTALAASPGASTVSKISQFTEHILSSLFHLRV